MLAASVSLVVVLWAQRDQVWKWREFRHTAGAGAAVSQERQRLLWSWGCGLAAGFNAPIAGVCFRGGTRNHVCHFSSKCGAAGGVVAALIAQIGLGTQPAFTYPFTKSAVRWNFLCIWVCLPVWSLLPIPSRSGSESLLFGCPVYWLTRIPPAVHPVIGGACVGWWQLQYPNIGYETIEAMLQDVIATQLLVVLLVIKLVMTAISLGSGLVGGVLRQRCFWVPLWDRLGNLAALLPAMSAMAALPLTPWWEWRRFWLEVPKHL